jgi:hypothetical protein
MRSQNSPNPKMTEQTRNPKREKSILYNISKTIMHPVETIKCLGDEKTRCNLSGSNNSQASMLQTWSEGLILKKKGQLTKGCQFMSYD